MACLNRCKGSSSRRAGLIDPPASGGPKGSALLGVLLAALIVVGFASPAAAQDAARFAVDSVLSIDSFGGENVSNQPQVIVDISAGARLSDGFQLHIRPWFRLPRPAAPGAPTPDWSTELYSAGIRYERSGNRRGLATRVDFGYNVSPIGLGIIDVRPSLNPVIAPHVSYLSPMPAFDLTVPRVSAISQTYPLGAQLTVSSAHWDARTAVINAAPTRNYALGRPTNPHQSPAYIAGAGMTPFTGLRLGLSLAHGTYATENEVTGLVRSDRSVTIVGGEGEYAFGYTRMSGEIVRSRFERLDGTAIAYEWFVQGLQTLSPRWSVAARHESTSAPELVTAISAGQRRRLTMNEATVGFRLTPEVTIRSSYYTRQPYGASSWDHQVGVQAVWARKWW